MLPAVQSNLFNTDTKGTELSVRFTEVAVLYIEVENVSFLAFLGQNELSVIERGPYYRGVRKERFDCSYLCFCEVSARFQYFYIRSDNVKVLKSRWNLKIKTERTQIQILGTFSSSLRRCILKSLIGWLHTPRVKEQTERNPLHGTF